MSNLAIVNTEVPMLDLASAFAKSGFFADSREASQAIVKIQAGKELGFPPVASMTGIHIISGRVSLSANLIASAIKRSTKYTYRVLALTDAECELEFYEGGAAVGKSKFTRDDAKRAGTKNMDRFPRNMLFARAISNGAKWYTPDVFGGPVYTPEELGADVDEDGAPVARPAPIQAEVVQLEPKKEEPKVPAKTGFANDLRRWSGLDPKSPEYVQAANQVFGLANPGKDKPSDPNDEAWERAHWWVKVRIENNEAFPFGLNGEPTTPVTGESEVSNG